MADSLIERLREPVEVIPIHPLYGATLTVTGDGRDPLRLEAATELERLTDALATAKADRNTYDSAHKAEAANVLRLSAEVARLKVDYDQAFNDGRSMIVADFNRVCAERKLLLATVKNQTKTHRAAKQAIRAELHEQLSNQGKIIKRLQAELEAVRRDGERYRDAFNAGRAFIDSHAADPDITPDMCVKYAVFDEHCRAIDAARDGEGEG